MTSTFNNTAAGKGTVNKKMLQTMISDMRDYIKPKSKDSTNTTPDINMTSNEAKATSTVTFKPSSSVEVKKKERPSGPVEDQLVWNDRYGMFESKLK